MKERKIERMGVEELRSEKKQTQKILCLFSKRKNSKGIPKNNKKENKKKRKRRSRIISSLKERKTERKQKKEPWYGFLHTNKLRGEEQRFLLKNFLLFSLKRWGEDVLCFLYFICFLPCGEREKGKKSEDSVFSPTTKKLKREL